MLAKIYPVSRTDVNSELGNAFANAPNIAKITFLGFTQAKANARLGDSVTDGV